MTAKYNLERLLKIPQKKACEKHKKTLELLQDHRLENTKKRYEKIQKTIKKI